MVVWKIANTSYFEGKFNNIFEGKFDNIDKINTIRPYIKKLQMVGLCEKLQKPKSNWNFLLHVIPC
jgi:hypothetical protein